MKDFLPKRIEGKLKLKNGIEIEAQPAYVRWRMLQGLSSVKPAEARALLALARGEDWLVPAETKGRLREENLWFDKEGKLGELERNVILSAWRDTADGPVIVDPFQLSTPEEVDLVARIERQDSRFLRYLFRGRNKPPQQEL